MLYWEVPLVAYPTRVSSLQTVATRRYNNHERGKADKSISNLAQAQAQAQAQSSREVIKTFIARSI